MSSLQYRTSQPVGKVTRRLRSARGPIAIHCAFPYLSLSPVLAFNYVRIELMISLSNRILSSPPSNQNNLKNLAVAT
jgi:hypothetical protein